MTAARSSRPASAIFFILLLSCQEVQFHAYRMSIDGKLKHEKSHGDHQPAPAEPGQWVLEVDIPKILQEGLPNFSLPIPGLPTVKFPAYPPSAPAAPDVTNSSVRSAPWDVFDVATLAPEQLQALIQRETKVLDRTATQYYAMYDAWMGEGWEDPFFGADPVFALSGQGYHFAPTPNGPTGILPADPIYIEYTNLAGTTSRHFALYLGKYRASEGDHTEYVIEFAGGAGDRRDQMSVLAGFVDCPVRIRSLESFDASGKRIVFKYDVLPSSYERLKVIQRSFKSLGMHSYNTLQLFGAQNSESYLSYWLNGKYRSKTSDKWKPVLGGMSAAFGVALVAATLAASLQWKKMSKEEQIACRTKCAEVLRHVKTGVKRYADAEISLGELIFSLPSMLGITRQTMWESEGLQCQELSAGKWEWALCRPVKPSFLEEMEKKQETDGENDVQEEAQVSHVEHPGSKHVEFTVGDEPTQWSIHVAPAPSVTGAVELAAYDKLVGDGWCRPSGCDAAADVTCRTHGIWKGGSSSTECESMCAATAGCIGFAISSPQSVNPNVCIVHTSGGDMPSGWSNYAQKYHDIASASGNSEVKCYAKVAL